MRVHVDVCGVFEGMYVDQSAQTSAKNKVFWCFFGMKLQSWKGGVYRVQGPGSRVRDLGISAARQWVGWVRRCCRPALEAGNSKPQTAPFDYAQGRLFDFAQGQAPSTSLRAKLRVRSGGRARSISIERASGEISDGATGGLLHRQGDRSRFCEGA